MALFTKQMRDSTKEVHNLSEALLDAKVAIALTDDHVWADGLLVFYEVFKFIEEVMKQLSDPLISELDIPEMRRTEAFQEDLTYYFGEGWEENYSPRESVIKYLEHLTLLKKQNPTLLIAYVYHLHMAVLAGAQILKHKKAVVQKLKYSTNGDTKGMSVLEIKEGTVSSLKKEMKERMNKIAESLDIETREKLLEESKMVFILNNEVIRSIKGTNVAFATGMLYIVGVIGIIIAILIIILKNVML